MDYQKLYKELKETITEIYEANLNTSTQIKIIDIAQFLVNYMEVIENKQNN